MYGSEGRGGSIDVILKDAFWRLRIWRKSSIMEKFVGDGVWERKVLWRR